MESKFGPRWSRSEDDRLSELISVYGDYAWDDISRNMSNAALVRTPIMCSTRWRLVLRKGIAMGPWSPQEDSMIMACVEKVVNSIIINIY